MVHNDSTPFLDEPPESPWRIRMKAHNRRSPLVKRVVAFAALVAVTLPFFLLFTYVRQTPRSSSSEDVTVTLDVVPPTHGPSTMEHIPNLPVNSSMTMSNPVIFSLIMFSFDSASEGAILMKSILMYSSQPVEFHILCDEEAKTYLERRLLLVKRPRQNVVVKFYDMPLSSIRARIGREGAIASDHSAGLPGLLKLFIHEVLPETVKKSIFVDTDAFFISDPVLLWRRFDTLPPQIAVSLPTHGDQNEPEWNFASNICSCVMLLNLERLRELRLMDSSLYREDGLGVTPIGPSAFQAMYGPPGPSGHYEGVKLGDQGYWWAIVSHRPDILEHLSYDWEVSSCLVTMYGTSLGDDDISETDERARQVHTVGTAEQGHVILPKLVHLEIS
ncbi:unnamed protein product [Somion occarium]|uniref:Uncharacterized protein n=1 Tax=Somion occarium TaxID=3059160 RepID=A0ABP1D7M7_9APHY